MVTATGIFLGFMLDFVNGWLPSSFTVYKFKDAVVAIGSHISIALLIVVLYRILRADFQGPVDRFYKRTLQLFIIAISIPFFAGVFVVIQKLFKVF